MSGPIRTATTVGTKAPPPVITSVLDKAREKQVPKQQGSFSVRARLGSHHSETTDSSSQATGQSKKVNDIYINTSDQWHRSLKATSKVSHDECKLRNSAASHSARKLQNKLESSPVQAQKPEKEVVVIAGMGSVGSAFTKVVAENSDKLIILFTRFPERYKDLLSKDSNIVILKTPDNMADPDAWVNSGLARHCEGAKSINVLNTIGDSTGRDGKSLKEVITDPAVGLAKAITKIAKTNGVARNTTFIQMSSIVTLLLGSGINAYRDERLNCDQQVLEVTEDLGKTVCLLLGMLMNTPVETRDGHFYINSGHAFSPDQWSHLPVQFVIGKGNQVMQVIAMEDVIRALENIAASPERLREVINAVGSDPMTQKELVEFFVRLHGKEPNVVSLPYKAVEAVTGWHEEGRATAYAPKLMWKLEQMAREGRTIDNSRFRYFVGQELKLVPHMFNPKPGQKIISDKAPIGKFCLNTARAIARHSTNQFLNTGIEALSHNGFWTAP